MKKILIITISLIFQLSHAKTPESEIQNIKPDSDEDYVIIYEENKSTPP